MIELIPLGDIEKRFLEELAAPVGGTFMETVEIGNRLELISGAWNPKRSQYFADAILDAVLNPPPGSRNLGVMDADIFAEGLNFVFGEADSIDRKALISIARLKQEFYGLPPDETILKERILKEAIHELGHTYGIKHCPNPRCVMHFSNTIQDTDIKSWQFCPVCQRKL